jgi:ribonuclease BN (tRNA processing enzyme)
MRADLVAGLKGTDIVIFDTHYTDEEYEKFPHWGHGTPKHALDVCESAGAKKLVLFHHAPGRTDDEQDAVLEATRKIAKGVEVIAAQEGLRVEV